MNDFSKATPRPWRFDFSDMNFYNEVGTGILTVHRRPKVVGQDDLKKPGLSIETKQNAELIEVAVNNYDKMKEFISGVKSFIDGVYSEGFTQISSSDTRYFKKMAEQILDSLK